MKRITLAQFVEEAFNIANETGETQIIYFTARVGGKTATIEVTPNRFVKTSTYRKYKDCVLMDDLPTRGCRFHTVCASIWR